VLNTNLRGVFLAMKYEIPYMLRNGGGNIVVTSSSNAIATTECRSGYTASKRGLVGLVQSTALADQLAELDLTPADITYFAFSHFHFDHTGNAGLFGRSTWIVNKAELAYARELPIPLGVHPHIAVATDKVKIQIVDNDYDVFYHVKSASVRHSFQWFTHKTPVGWRFDSFRADG
jgi:glyoxylase-like metal-dependent hydrolase (beta-lactamase superfamily II)